MTDEMTELQVRLNLTLYADSLRAERHEHCEDECEMTAQTKTAIAELTAFEERYGSSALLRIVDQMMVEVLGSLVENTVKNASITDEGMVLAFEAVPSRQPRHLIVSTWERVLALARPCPEEEHAQSHADEIEGFYALVDAMAQNDYTATTEQMIVGCALDLMVSLTNEEMQVTATNTHDPLGEAIRLMSEREQDL